MARLVARFQGIEIGNLLLEEGHDYAIGRSEDCAIILPPQKGLSRHHLKLYLRDGVWIVELLARFGAIKVDGKESQILELDRDRLFHVVPFEFSYIHKEVELPVITSAGSLPSISQVNTSSLSLNTSYDPDDRVGNNDATVARRGQQLTAFIRVTSKGKDEVLKLEGHLWVGGRDQTCEICLQENRASRRHFELLRTADGLFITDLASANGTLLNDEALPANEPFQLTSGDVIRIGNTKITLEIRDLNFAANLPAIVPSAWPPPGAIPSPSLPTPMPYDQQAMVPTPYHQQSHRDDFQMWTGPAAPPPKPNRVKYILMALVPLIIYGILHQENGAEKPAVPTKTDSSSQAPTFEQLSKDQQQAIKDSFALAKNMYLQGRYELCVAELNKLHEVIPAFENSREFDTFCKNGSQLERAQQDKERRDRERADTERAILQIVDDCRRNKGMTLNQMKLCLAPAIERAPDNPAVIELLQTMEMRQDQRNRQQATIEARKREQQLGQKMFERARSFFTSGDIKRAVSEYERFLASKYPGVDQERDIAQRDLAQVRKEMNEKVAIFVRVCKENLEKNLYRDAYSQCAQALQEQPGNAEAKQLQARAQRESRKELKGVYEDSMLEESMGNIDGAKDRWKQILNKAIPGDDYFKKAKRNLQKYEVTD